MMPHSNARQRANIKKWCNFIQRPPAEAIFLLKVTTTIVMGSHYVDLKSVDGLTIG